jgi:hypothetical protein
VNYVEARRSAIGVGASLSPPTMSYDECVRRSYPHNQRMRFTHGFYCEDCGNFYPEKSLEYQLHQGDLNPLTQSMRHNNIAVKIFRSEGETEAYRTHREKSREWQAYKWDIVNLKWVSEAK